MTIEKFSEILYKELPEQNLGYVLGGILVYPNMFGLVLPLKMEDQDLYRYTTRYIKAMDILANARSQEDGDERMKELARGLEVDYGKWVKDNSYIYMLESIMSGKPLPTDFNSIKQIYGMQARRGRVILMDLAHSVEPEFVTAVTKGDSKILQITDAKIAANLANKQKPTATVNTVTPSNIKPTSIPQTNTKPISMDMPNSVNMNSNVNMTNANMINANMTNANTALALTNQTNTTNQANVAKLPEETLLDKAKKIVTAPPFLIGAATIGGYFLIKNMSSEPQVARNPRRKHRRKHV